ncbi:putative suppressor of disruption of TFIIS [Sorochytrium milnesiophthora]
MRDQQPALTFFPVPSAPNVTASLASIVQPVAPAGVKVPRSPVDPLSDAVEAQFALAAVQPGATTATTLLPVQDQPKAYFFFDIDNTLYHPSKGISQLMATKIVAYCRSMGMDEQTAQELSFRYYREYGLAIRGLVRHHQIDADDYDIRVDGSLPLEEVLQPDPELRTILHKLKPDIKKWVFTNAYVRHAKRVLKILGIEDCFDGMTYCDYLAQDFNCKPDRSFYEQALADAGYTSDAQEAGVPVYFVDDSRLNIVAAKKLGWTTIFLASNGATCDAADYTIEDVKEIANVLPQLFDL